MIVNNRLFNCNKNYKMALYATSSCSSDSDDNVPLETLEGVKEIALNCLPSTSKNKYKKGYDEFKKWSSKNSKKGTTFEETVLLIYFNELSAKYAPSSLWSKFSMLKATIKAYDNIDISTYSRLIALLKQINKGYNSKKSKIFTEEEILKFLHEAPDEQYLVMKALLVIGVSGACRREELTNICMDDVKDQGTFLFITLTKTKTKIVKTFAVVGEFYKTVKKYMVRRPADSTTNRFFLTYRNGKCVSLPLGINKIGCIPQEIAKFLKLDNPELYTGHTYRRTSAKIVIKAGGDSAALKKNTGWKLNEMAEGHIEESLVESVILNQLENNIQEDEDSEEEEIDNRPKVIEVCVDNIQSAINASEGGAKRIELCSALSEGGLTPSVGILKVLKRIIDIPIYVMIRPRNGSDFVYDEHELSAMIHDVQELKAAGADGFVYGVLKNDRTVDLDACEKIMQIIRPMPATFHRAFDCVVDVFDAMEDIVNLGFTRILTSGQKQIAFDGIDLIKELVLAARNRITIMPGSGINEDNICEIMKCCNVHEVHGSFRIPQSMSVALVDNGVHMGSNNSEQVMVTDKNLVEKIVKSINEINLKKK